MTRRFPFRIAVTILLLVVAAACAPQPVYQGKTLKAWTKMLDDADAATRRVALDALVVIGEPSIKALAARLRDPDEAQRLEAVEALGRIRHSGVGTLDLALNDSSTKVRYAALLAAAGLGDAALPVVVGAAGNSDPLVRLAAVVALGSDGIADPAAERALLAGLKDQDDAVRLASFLSLLGHKDWIRKNEATLRGERAGLNSAARATWFGTVPVIYERLGLKVELAPAARPAFPADLSSEAASFLAFVDPGAPPVAPEAGAAATARFEALGIWPIKLGRGSSAAFIVRLRDKPRYRQAYDQAYVVGRLDLMLTANDAASYQSTVAGLWQPGIKRWAEMSREIVPLAVLDLDGDGRDEIFCGADDHYVGGMRAVVSYDFAPDASRPYKLVYDVATSDGLDEYGGAKPSVSGSAFVFRDLDGDGRPEVLHVKSEQTFSEGSMAGAQGPQGAFDLHASTTTLAVLRFAAVDKPPVPWYSPGGM